MKFMESLKRSNLESPTVNLIEKKKSIDFFVVFCAFEYVKTYIGQKTNWG